MKTQVLVIFQSLSWDYVHSICSMLRKWSLERDRNISKTGYSFYILFTVLYEWHEICLKKVLIQITRKASRKSDIHEVVFFSQSHTNGQKIHAWKPKAYSNKMFDQKNILTFRRLLPKITWKIFFIFHIKQYWRFQEVTTKWYYTLFQSLYQTILTLSESYH